MYDTEKRVELVKKRVHEKYRRKERRGICRLSALCMALSAFLVWGKGAHSSRPDADHRPGNVRFYPAA